MTRLEDLFLSGEASLAPTFFNYTDPIGFWVITVLAIVALLFVLLTVTAYVVWFERVGLGRMQRRPGPNRVGPSGLMQSAADAVKMIFKESFTPKGVDPVIYVLAPAIIVIASLTAWAVIPVGLLYGVDYWIANLNIGILFIFWVTAMNAYALLLAGWSSNNKYSLLGGLRAAAQLVSYEVSMGLSLVPIFMITHSLRLQDIANYSVHWNFYNGPIPLILLAPLSFIIYMMSAVSETNRAPFDLPEAEQELIGGYLTEYSGLKFLCFYLGEYVNMLTTSAVATIVFLAAWNPTYPWLPAIIPFVIKIVLLLFFYIWLRATLPRLRYDMLMRLGWKLLLPLAIANVMITAVVLVAVGG
ncbi:MAG: NADH-quinone oxidoreductase subunit NuoH [Candidatus Dormibacteraceae bacterium]